MSSREKNDTEIVNPPFIVPSVSLKLSKLDEIENFIKLCKERLDSRSTLHTNGQCIMWTGYGQYRYRDNRDLATAGHRTRSIDRMALMVKARSLDIQPEQQAGHLCNNKLCINADHIVFEDNYTINYRKTCFLNENCCGHQRQNDIKRPHCLVELNESNKM